VESTVLQRLENLAGSPGAAPYAGFETTHASGANGIALTLSASNSIVK
jgi:hypothetical protein